jgi:hypothetical protein
MAQGGWGDGVGAAFEEMDQVEFYRTQVKNSRIQEFKNSRIRECCGEVRACGARFGILEF